MGRQTGVANIKTLEYIQEYDRLCKIYSDPLEVIFKMLKARKQQIKLAAAQTLISYRYPKQAVATLELEKAGQLVLAWEETVDLPPPEPLDITSQVEVLEH